MEKEIMRVASRRGITKETFGEWLNLAARNKRLGDLEKASDCAKQALSIHAEFGMYKAYYIDSACVEKAKSYVIN